MSSLASPADTPVRAFVSLACAERKPGVTVPSPCVGVCRMSDSSGLCEGCWRTLDELRAWGKSDDAGKLAIWHLVEQRQDAAGIPR